MKLLHRKNGLFPAFSFKWWMSHSFHYLIMSEHSMLQKELLAKLKGTGLTA